MLLWEEYKEKHPAGIMYTQFCGRYRKFKKDNKISLHKEHKAGEEMEVDWAGDHISYVKPGTGEIIKASLFVAVLPASAYPFVYAYDNMKMPNWIDAHVRAYTWFGGVPKITIPDNTKTAVIKSDLVDPVLNKSYQEMARHYRTTVIPARAGRPKDKAADENMFFSLYEINQAIAEELEKFIHRPFQKMEGNRKAAFLKIDKPCLQPLPLTRYEYAQWKETKVAFNYHVDYDHFFYSVHYSYVNLPCSIRATSKTIEIYVGHKRVAAYPRNYNTSKRYTTLEEHMPDEHRAVYGWSSDRFLLWADKTGPNTREFIKKVLKSREYPVQSYRACMGIMRLAKGYPLEIMETASREALDKNICSYKYFNLILKQVVSKLSKIEDDKIIQHENVRGSRACAGGGIYA